MLIIACYFKKICGINQAEDRVTWPDFLHRHTIALVSFREWSVVSGWLRIRAQPRNPCQPRNSASASTWLLDRYKISGHRLEILVRQEQSSPGGSDGKRWADMSQIERD